MKYMDDRNMNRILMEKAGQRFGSHEVLRSKYTPQIPPAAEREYIRIANAYVRIVKESLEEGLLPLLEAYREERNAAVRESAGMRTDSATDLMLAVMKALTAVKNQIIARIARFDLDKKLEALARLTRKQTTREWKKAISATIGVEIDEDYYLSGFCEKELREWIEYNVSLIKSIPEDTLDQMQEIIFDGYRTGATTTDLAARIQKAYSVSRKKARLLARDQIAKLNGQIQKAEQEDAGVSCYIWRDSGDGRVRERHHQLNGHMFRWDTPPVVDMKTMRRAHPEEDYNCRCVAIPVLDRRTLKLPLANT